MEGITLSNVHELLAIIGRASHEAQSTSPTAYELEELFVDSLSAARESIREGVDPFELQKLTVVNMLMLAEVRGYRRADVEAYLHQL